MGDSSALLFFGALLAACIYCVLRVSGVLYEWHINRVVRKLAKEFDTSTLREQLKKDYRCFSTTYTEIGWHVDVSLPDLSTSELPTWPVFMVRASSLLRDTARSYQTSGVFSKEEYYAHARNRSAYLAAVAERLLTIQHVAAEPHN
jgi:hypothetical protein